MKTLLTGILTLAVFVAPGFCGDSSHPAGSHPVKTRRVAKMPFFRPHYNKRLASHLKPRQSSGPVIVNAASYEEGVSPGGLATIFGQDLTTVSGILYANSDPLPLHLAGVEVDVSGIPAPIYGIAYAGGQDQISIQVPYDAPTGPGAAEIQVFDNGDLVADFFTDSFTEDPGIFTYDSGLAIAQASDYSLISEDNPALAGEPLVLYTTGLGPLDQNLVDGYGAPTQEPLARTIDPFDVILDGEICTVFFSGLAPGFVGLYQVNFYVPDDAASGDLEIYIQDQYANSATAILPVR